MIHTLGRQASLRALDCNEHSRTQWWRQRRAANATAAADLIGTMATELAQLARRHGLDALGYLLDMARLEADNLTRGSERPGGAN
jgi:hypothetical protein